MKRWLLSLMILAGGGTYATHTWVRAVIPGTDEAEAPVPGPDLGKCQAANAAADAEAWKTYCSSLSPSSRRDRCAEQQSESPARRQSWCSAEWDNQPPSDVGSWTPISSAAEANLPGQCQPDPPGYCCPDSPIVIDVRGNGFDLTDAANGVVFDIRANGDPRRVAWTSVNPDDVVRAPDDVWLALDRNANGTIDDGSELFGNYTNQPPSNNPNGFIALAEFDKDEAGGNGDSQINSADRIFSRLRLWSDANHNGKSERAELHPLASLGVAAISLEYRVSLARDEHGNAFRYRARVHGAPGSHLGPFAYDVFLVTDDAAAIQASCPQCRCTSTTFTRVTSPPPPGAGCPPRPSPCGYPYCFCDPERTLARYRCVSNYGTGAREITGACVDLTNPAELIEAQNNCSQYCQSRGPLCLMPTPNPPPPTPCP